MGILQTIRKRLTTQYIGVMVYEDICVVNVQKVKHEKIIFEEEKSFTLATKEKFTKEVIKYLQARQEEVEQTYVALFLNTHGQGVVPSCDQSIYDKFHIDYDNIKSVCIDGKYAIYASNIDIKWAEKLFADVGLDFIFSPFLILESLRKHALRKPEGVVLYMLVGINSITVMIFKEERLLYGTFINIAREEDLLTSEFADDFMDEGDDDILDEIDLDMELEESEEISELLEEAGSDKKSLTQQEDDTIKLKLFGQDLRLVKYFDASLREFYDNKRYESDFVTYVKIYDGADLNPEIVRYLKEQLLVDIEVQKTEIDKELMKLLKQEVDVIA